MLFENKIVHLKDQLNLENNLLGREDFRNAKSSTLQEVLSVVSIGAFGNCKDKKLEVIMMKAANGENVRSSNRLGACESSRLRTAKKASRELNILAYMSSKPDKDEGEVLSKIYAEYLMKIIGMKDYYVSQFQNGNVCKSCITGYGVEQATGLSNEDKEIIATLDAKNLRVYHVLKRENYQGETISTYLFVPKDFFNVPNTSNAKGLANTKESKSTVPVDEYLTREFDTAARKGVKGYEVSQMGDLRFHQFIDIVNLIIVNGMPIRIN